MENNVNYTKTAEQFDKVKVRIKEIVDGVSYNTWFEPLTFFNEDNQTIYLMSPSSFTQSVILKRRYPEKLKELFFEETGIAKDFMILSPEDVDNSTPLKDDGMDHSNLNPKYVFEDFIVGNNNNFAHAACVAVAEDPSESFNPLFIYGGVGLGKTHLMQAIGHHIKNKNPHAKVLYTSSENFTNEFIQSLKNDRGENFRNRYRNIDVLLIDDIQFIADKRQTQEEFFHTFNELYNNNRQIVISSDRPPSEINTLADRLRSRFEWGLITDIQPPDFETRVAILQKKAEKDGKNVPSEVFDLIAKNVKSNIRELEGALNKVNAYSSLVGREIDLELTKEALQDILIRNLPKAIDEKFIREVICTTFEVTEKELDSPRRTKKIAYPRQIAMYLIREYTDLSLPKIGEIFGGRDHSTVVHACDKITKELETNTTTQTLIENLKKELMIE